MLVGVRRIQSASTVLVKVRIMQILQPVTDAVSYQKLRARKEIDYSTVRC